ncbi:MAG: hypothetical protein QXI33_01030 [Candidatus Pacearchaeota archaeon]
MENRTDEIIIENVRKSIIDFLRCKIPKEDPEIDPVLRITTLVLETIGQISPNLDNEAKYFGFDSFDKIRSLYKSALEYYNKV